MFKFVMLFLVLAIGGSVLAAWPLMIGFGNLHDVWPTVPAIGFWASVSVSVPFGLWVAAMSQSTSGSS